MINASSIDCKLSDVVNMDRYDHVLVYKNITNSSMHTYDFKKEKFVLTKTEGDFSISNFVTKNVLVDSQLYKDCKDNNVTATRFDMTIAGVHALAMFIHLHR